MTWSLNNLGEKNLCVIQPPTHQLCSIQPPDSRRKAIFMIMSGCLSQITFEKLKWQRLHKSLGDLFQSLITRFGDLFHYVPS